jgi:hypothetical protein
LQTTDARGSRAKRRGKLPQGAVKAKRTNTPNNPQHAPQPTLEHANKTLRGFVRPFALRAMLPHPSPNHRAIPHSRTKDALRFRSPVRPSGYVSLTLTPGIAPGCPIAVLKTLRGFGCILNAYGVSTSSKSDRTIGNFTAGDIRRDRTRKFSATKPSGIFTRRIFSPRSHFGRGTRYQQSQE